MTPAKIADTRPLPVELKAGEKVWWCACGRSQNQPFCDGSHQGSGMAPVALQVEQTQTYYFCLCKRTGNPPLCDGSHKGLTQADLDAQAG